MGRAGKKADRLDVADNERSTELQFDLRPIHAGIGRGLTPEASYTGAVSFDHRRRYAQFFTPPKVAGLMAEWAIKSDTKTLLEPALGMGALVRAALQRSDQITVTAFEKDSTILKAFLGTKPDLSRIEVLLGDFLTSEVVSEFDSVLMNPPYLRHHDLTYDFDIFGSFSRRYSIELSKLSNSYLLFTVKASTLLKPGARAAVIIPTEWMNANFGAAMKKFLIVRGFLREIIYFSNCSEIFEDALTTACVLLLERPI